MRATDRIAFRREIEDLEEERQRELAERLELCAIAADILSCFDLALYANQFVSCADGLAILANCCNFAAKVCSDRFYNYKPMLINAATEQHNECWQHEGIVYIETSIGQVSFHALQEEDEDLPPANGRVWSGLEYQFNAPIVAKAWLDGCSKQALHKLIERSA